MSTPNVTHSRALSKTPPAPQCQCGVTCSLHASPVQVTQVFENQPIRVPRPHPPPPTTQASGLTEAACTARLSTHAVTEVPVAHVPGPAVVPTVSGLSGFETLTPVSIVHDGKTHTALRLLPGPSPPYTPFDMVLPEPVAFCDPMNMTVDRYPTFTSRNCNWTSVFAMIKQPALLWKVWRPESLGSYPNVRLLWQAWDEGTLIEGVSRKPPLRLVDEEWGLQKHWQTLKGRLPSWRPHQNASVRQTWSQFQFFVKRIEQALANGSTASKALQDFELQRGDQSMPKFHKFLQPRKGAKNKRLPDTTGTSSLPGPSAACQ
ncbi:hypothetical protein EDB86DRAFT_2804633 [Lactarius hatsudake]|nr:hypothetical protein EDB86DRAFT_2804633 [Lactarius hatsudake]